MMTNVTFQHSDYRDRLGIGSSQIFPSRSSHCFRYYKPISLRVIRVFSLIKLVVM